MRITFLFLTILLLGAGCVSKGEFPTVRTSEFPDEHQVESWQLVNYISGRDNFAPSIVPLYEGGYRIYWNDSAEGGITSAASEDAVHFTPEEGMRLENGEDGSQDCISSHPWVVQMDGGYRMYYQGNVFCDLESGRGDVDYRIFSAFSKDGLKFVREGVVVDSGKETGFKDPAHGRVFTFEDGTYRMFFTTGFLGKDSPSDILGATSEDGIDWEYDDTITAEGVHDPTVVLVDGIIHLYGAYLKEGVVSFVSDDGYAFTPGAWLNFYDKNGQLIEEVGDIDCLLTEDGHVYIYGSGKGMDGLAVFEKMKE